MYMKPVITKFFIACRVVNSDINLVYNTNLFFLLRENVRHITDFIEQAKTAYNNLRTSDSLAEISSF